MGAVILMVGWFIVRLGFVALTCGLSVEHYVFFLCSGPAVG
jgi:hypothetical protein